MEVSKIMQELERKHPGESEFLQAVKEVLIFYQGCLRSASRV